MPMQQLLNKIAMELLDTITVADTCQLISYLRPTTTPQNVSSLQITRGVTGTKMRGGSRSVWAVSFMGGQCVTAVEVS